MIRIIIIFILALIPSLFGLKMIRQYQRKFQARMRRIRAEPVSQVAVVSNFLDVPQRKFFIGEMKGF